MTEQMDRNRRTTTDGDGHGVPSCRELINCAWFTCLELPLPPVCVRACRACGRLLELNERHRRGPERVVDSGRRDGDEYAWLAAGVKEYLQVVACSVACS
jgi:hypothetical protein